MYALLAGKVIGAGAGAVHPYSLEENYDKTIDLNISLHTSVLIKIRFYLLVGYF